MSVLQRENIANLLLDCNGKSVIKVLTGANRPRKSTALQKFANELAMSGVSKRQLLPYNFEEPIINAIASRQEYYDIVNSKLPKGRNYIFIDEVQDLNEFQKLLNDWQIFKKIDDLCITGSNAQLRSEELATLLSGKYITSKSSNTSNDVSLDAFLKNRRKFKTFFQDAIDIYNYKHKKALRNSDIYNGIGITKQAFYSILRGYTMPSKDTALKIAFLFEYTFQEAEELLKHARHSLGSDTRDLIFAFCFEKRIFDILEVNEKLKQNYQRVLVKDRKKSILN